MGFILFKLLDYCIFIEELIKSLRVFVLDLPYNIPNTNL
jgi:hypothetical protein